MSGIPKMFVAAIDRGIAMQRDGSPAEDLNQAWAEAMEIGAREHPLVRGYVSDLIESAESAGRELIEALLAPAAVEDAASLIFELAQKTPPVMAVESLRDIYRRDSGIWRGDGASSRALVALVERYIQSETPVRELIRLALLHATVIRDDFAKQSFSLLRRLKKAQEQQFG